MTQLGDLAADIQGESGASTPLILLHGLTFDRSMWRPIAEQVAKADPERLVVAFDLPGHGASEPQGSYSVEAVAEAVHRAGVDGGLDAPVMVGHSVSGLIATIYAARYPTRGVVNVDQPLDVTAFAELVRSLEDRLRGPEFPNLWAMFETSFHAELLPVEAQALVRSHPRQDLVLGYWNQIFELPSASLNAMIDAALATVREQHLHYTFVSGSAVDPGYKQWLSNRLPHLRIVEWANSSHFPHLSRPGPFAEILRETANW